MHLIECVCRIEIDCAPARKKFMGDKSWITMCSFLHDDEPGNVFAFLICPAEGSTVTWMLLWCCRYTGNVYRGNHWFSFFYLCFDEHAGCKITSRFLLAHKGNSNLLINEAASLTPAPVPGVGAWKKKNNNLSLKSTSWSRRCWLRQHKWHMRRATASTLKKSHRHEASSLPTC